VFGASCLRFRNKTSLHEFHDETFETKTTTSQSDLSIQGDESTNCLLVRNDMGHTPLLLAIYSHAGWEVIESLLCGQVEPCALDSEKNNALHLLVSEHYKDPAAALAVLRFMPEAASVRNEKGMLPIEVSLANAVLCVKTNKSMTYISFVTRRLLACKYFPVKSFLGWYSLIFPSILIRKRLRLGKVMDPAGGTWLANVTTITLP
jgi:hypothetical protein